MKNIFLSRPNWIHPDYEEGLKNFLNLIKSHDLNPRTIGTTDFPSKSPMDGVIDLMNQCEGAIILGYPQINISIGHLKEKEVSSLYLATEWNHIETAIAYSLGLPLLVIHDTNVTRGVFDRGVLNSFLYSKNFADTSWSISDEIIGALSKWKDELMPINILNNKEKKNHETPKSKWGALEFEGDENLYCPVCYEKKNLKIVTSRINSKFRQCPNCKAMLS
ncbi:hypothetical protein GALL_204800 [mine drainage metagenome]|uniref:Nucleoside 2-deoxyribosyltransferase n=1 Tax=mine drainage metagenome TaxID=410659 RepID=A0A1J5RN49_9ZZZZ